MPSMVGIATETMAGQMLRPSASAKHHMDCEYPAAAQIFCVLALPTVLPICDKARIDRAQITAE